MTREPEPADDASHLHLESLALALRPTVTRSTDPSWLPSALDRLREEHAATGAARESGGRG